MQPITLCPKDFGTFDLCVLGGSCTGVFAAVRAARLGLRVALIEQSNRFGGVATLGLVNIWHSLYDIHWEKQIIAGLTDEVADRLRHRGCLEEEKSESTALRFDPNELAFTLDNLVAEHSNITPFLHTSYCSLSCENTAVKSVLVNNKDGLGLIYASFFIDATGDGDLMRDLGMPSYRHSRIQPPTSCFFLLGKPGGDIAKLVTEHGDEFGLGDDWGWSTGVPGISNLTMRADNHIFDVDCSKAKDLTKAETEGRKKAFAFSDLIRKYGNPDAKIVSLCSSIGIRDTVHYETDFKAQENGLLLGVEYPDAILHGTYRVDIHHAEDNGITFKYLDGRSETLYGKSARRIAGNWREEMGLSGNPAPFYSVPFSILVQDTVDNLIPVGRMLNADMGAFGALRVMVNLNQLGEAAGVAAYLSLHTSLPIRDLNGVSVKNELNKGGSAL